MTEEQKVRRSQQAAKRREQTMAIKEAWKMQVATHFDYLQTGYGLRPVTMEHSWDVTRVPYRSSTTAIHIDRSVEFNRVEIGIGRIVDDVISEPPVSNPLKITLTECLLDQVLAIRAPQLGPEITSLGGLADEQIETALVFWAAALQDYGKDILRGIFDIFAEVEANLKRRG